MESYTCTTSRSLSFMCEFYLFMCSFSLKAIRNISLFIFYVPTIIHPLVSLRFHIKSQTNLHILSPRLNFINYLESIKLNLPHNSSFHSYKNIWYSLYLPRSSSKKKNLKCNKWTPLKFNKYRVSYSQLMKILIIFQKIHNGIWQHFTIILGVSIVDHFIILNQIINS